MDYHHRVVTLYMPNMLVDVLLRFALPVLLIVVDVNHGPRQLTVNTCLVNVYDVLKPPCILMRRRPIVVAYIYIYIYIYSVDYLYAPAVVNCVIIYVLTVCA